MVVICVCWVVALFLACALGGYCVLILLVVGCFIADRLLLHVVFGFMVGGFILLWAVWVLLLMVVVFRFVWFGWIVLLADFDCFGLFCLGLSGCSGEFGLVFGCGCLCRVCVCGCLVIWL